MSFRRRLLGGLAAAALALTATAASAQSDWVHAYEAALEAAQTGDAVSAAEGQLAAAPGDRQARFALGTAKFFGAVEGFGQDMYRYGLKSDYTAQWLMFGGVPFVRLPVAENPSPEPVTYEKLRESLRKFVGALEAADAELAKVAPGATTLTLDLSRVRLDMNADGAAGAEEGIMPVLAAVLGGGRMAAGAAPSLIVDFDESDVLWLRAYAHLVVGMGDFLLGYDWKSAYDIAFYAMFPSGEFPDTPILPALRANERRLAALGDPQLPAGMSQWGDEYQEWIKTPEGARYAEAAQLRQASEWGGIADVIGFIHEIHWPVAEPDRLAAVHSHLKSMVALSRANWQSVQAETDANREWIPNLNQKGVLPGMTITQERILGWAQMLDQFDAILDGKLLIPHWRFTQGLNFKRLLLEPQVLDIVLLLQGSAAVPYLEDGETIDGATWGRISTLMEGNFMRYFLWIN